jgi:type I restriction enzyme S subunit
LISWSATLGAYIYRGEEAVLNQHIFKVRPYIDKLFLFYLTSFSISQLMKKIYGSGMQHITKGVFESHQFPLPPLPEQRRIVAEVERRLSIADGVEKTVAQSLAQAQRLRQSILKKAFEGRLVAQDANDEPAGVLLERIKQEKARLVMNKQKSKITKDL